MYPLVAALLVVLFLAAQGFLMQTAVALTGDPAPKYGRALTTAWLAALASFVGKGLWSYTIGIFVGLFSSTLASVLAMVVGVSLAAAVVRGRIKLSGGHALVVGALFYLMATGAWYAVWWVYNALF